MVAINFTGRFADLVEQGRKFQTIRRLRKDRRPPCKVGDTLTFYRGLRTKRARKIGEDVCTSLELVRISACGAVIKVDNRILTVGKEDRLAVDDGFLTARQLIAWIDKTHGLPFEGWLIKWRPLDHDEGEAP